MPLFTQSLATRQGFSSYRLRSGVLPDARHAWLCKAPWMSNLHVTVHVRSSRLQVARRHAGEYAQRLGLVEGALRFIEGRIEDLEGAGVAPESADVVISNCVVNLSPDKPKVLAGAWRALAPGGEMHFADVYADRRLSEVGRPCMRARSLGASATAVLQLQAARLRPLQLGIVFL